MNPEAQRIAIATACGWKKIPPPMEMRWGEQSKEPEWWYVHHLPDYLNSFDAIIPAIQSQPMDVISKMIPISFRSTPPQLCESLLKALGKWTDAPEKPKEKA